MPDVLATMLVVEQMSAGMSGLKTPFWPEFLFLKKGGGSD